MINLVGRGFGTAPQSKRTIGIYLSKILCEFDFDIHHRLVGLTATTASPMVDYGRGHSFFLKMAMVAEF